MNYWSHQGKFQKEYEHLYEAHVPLSGMCDTMAGEAIRAASKIYYDAYNNGFLNNTSGAWNWLNKFVYTQKMNEALSVLEPCVNTGTYSKIDANVAQALEMMVDEAVQFAQTDKAKERNPADMLVLSDKDEYPEEEYWDEDEEEYLR